MQFSYSLQASKLPRTLIIVVGIVGYMILLIPYWLGFDLERLANSPLRDAVISTTYGRTVFAFMVSTVPLLIDTLLDFFQRFSSKSTNNYVLGRFIYASVSFTSSVLLVQNSFFPELVIFTADPVLTYLLIIYGLRIGTASALMYILASVSPNVCGVILPLLITLYVVATNITRFYYLIFFDRPFKSSVIMLLFLLILIICVYIYWSILLYRKRKAWTLQDYSAIMYMIIYLITYTGSFMTLGYRIHARNLYSDVFSSTTIDISVTALSFVVSTVLMTIVPGRIARLEASNNLKTIMDTKKSYVRYISHELRTPMNTVYMGINLCMEDNSDTATDSSRSMQTTSGSFVIEEDRVQSNKLMTMSMSMSQKQDILKDTSVACNAAIDILNDLLLYDKVENDMMVLNKTKEPISELVYDSLKLFNIQYRQKKIELVVENGNLKEDKSKSTIGQYSIRESDNSSKRNNCTSNEVDTLCESNTSTALEIQDNNAITYKDIVELDKSKIVQVIRNVMSNALKFTPEGGHIYVNMRYEEECVVPTATNESMTANRRSFIQFSYREMYGRIKCLSHHLCTFLHSVSRGLNPRHFREPTNDDCDTINTPGHKGHLVLTIRDTGAGISTENQSLLFHNIIQFKPEILQHGGGSGLGLYISKSIIDKHHGTINVYSAGEGQGTTFTIKLPMTRTGGSKVSNSHYNTITDELVENVAAAAATTTTVDMKKSRSTAELYQNLYTTSQHGVYSSLSYKYNVKFTSRGYESSNFMQSTSAVITDTRIPTESMEPSPESQVNRYTHLYGDGDHHYDPFITVTEENLRDTDISTNVIKKRRSIKTMATLTRNIQQSDNNILDPTHTDYKVATITNTYMVPIDSDRTDSSDCQSGKLIIGANIVTEQDLIPTQTDTIINTDESMVHKVNISKNMESSDYSMRPVYQKHIVNSMICDDYAVGDIDSDTDKDSIDNHRSSATTTTISTKSYLHTSHSSTMKDTMPSLNSFADMTTIFNSTALYNQSSTNPLNSNSNTDFRQGLWMKVMSLKPPVIDMSTTMNSSTSNSNLHAIYSSPDLRMSYRHVSNTSSNHSSATSSRATSFSESASQSSSVSKSMVMSPRRRLHVLIVDDSSMNRKMMARLLSSVHYTYNEAGDGVEAVQIMTQSMKRHPYSRQTSDHVSDVVSGQEPVDKTYEKFLLKPFDVILIDFMMPNMDGPTATAEIRKLGYTGLIYGVTGNAQQFDIDHFMEKGANKVLIKPLVLSDLSKALKSHFSM